MTLKKIGRYWYGTSPKDIQGEVVRFSQLNTCRATQFSQSVCSCGNRSFALETDENEGVAKRTCCHCGAAHFMGDSAEYADAAQLQGHECLCGADDFELMSGVSLDAGSNDVHWYYIGCRCLNCHLVGVFADWKCAGGDAQVFLDNT